jgi:dTDP-glucose pyrophosphorylase
VFVSTQAGYFKAVVVAAYTQNSITTLILAGIRNMLPIFSPHNVLLISELLADGSQGALKLSIVYSHHLIVCYTTLVGH